MNKLFAAIIAAAFAAVSFGAVAAKHEEGMKKEEKKAVAHCFSWRATGNWLTFRP